jgi:putative salt-induced outer membrane protein YdiY
LGGEYITRPGPWVLRAKTAYIRNKSEDELKAETFAVLGRATRALTSRLSAFGEYGYLHDRFAGIESRNTVGGGVTFALVRPRPHELEVDGALGYAHENRVVGESISGAEAGTGVRYKLTVSETADITDELNFSFSLSEARDWRMRNTVALTAKVTTVFSLKISNNVRYVHTPPEAFETTDVITSVALVAKF